MYRKQIGPPSTQHSARTESQSRTFRFLLGSTSDTLTSVVAEQGSDSKFRLSVYLLIGRCVSRRMWTDKMTILSLLLAQRCLLDHASLGEVWLILPVKKGTANRRSIPEWRNGFQRNDHANARQEHLRTVPRPCGGWSRDLGCILQQNSATAMPEGRMAVSVNAAMPPHSPTGTLPPPATAFVPVPGWAACRPSGCRGSPWSPRTAASVPVSAPSLPPANRTESGPA